MASRFDFTIRIGDSWPPGPDAEFIAVLRSGPKDGVKTPIDLTGYAVSVVLLAKASDETSAITLNVDVKDQVSLTGQVGVSIPASESARLTQRTYHFRLIVDFGNDQRTTFIAGAVQAVEEEKAEVTW